MICFSDLAWKDYVYWQKQDKKVLKRINELIKDIARNPDNRAGIGKPEMLKGDLSGYCSKRIAKEHRLVYKVADNKILIAQCRFHY